MQNLYLIGAFCALPYILNAVLQVVRGQSRVGGWGTFLAYAGVAIPLVVLALDTVGADSQPLLTAAALANAVIVLVISAVILALEVRKPERDLNHSFGALGLSVGALLMVGVFITPAVVSLAAEQAGAPRVLANSSPNAVGENNSNPAAAGDSALTAALAVQTGLSSDEVLAQVNAGTPIGQLVAAHGGDATAVTTALTSTIETGIANGTLPASMLERFGGDAAGLAGQLVNGEVPGQAQGFLLSALLQPASAPTGAGGFQGRGTSGTGANDAGGFGGAQTRTNGDGSARTSGGNTANAAVATPTGAPASETAPENSDLQAALKTATGLEPQAMIEQITGGASLAALIETNGGDGAAVTTALTAAFEQAPAEGTLSQQMLSRFGGDAAGLAAGIVNGDVPGQFASRLLGNLLGLAGSGFGGSGFQGRGNSGSGANSGGFGGNAPGGNAAARADAPAQPTAANTPAEPITQAKTGADASTQFKRVTIEITPFTFATPQPFSLDALPPTATPLPAQAQTCAVTTTYNLNLRAAPSLDGDWLLTIPAASVITASSHNADNWWQVTYEGQSGWVSGEYVAPGYTCQTLPTLR